MKREEVKVSENLTMINTEVCIDGNNEIRVSDENGTEFMGNLFQKLSGNIQLLSAKEEEMLLEDIDQEFIEKETKTMLFLSVACNLVADAKTYMAPAEAFRKMNSEMEDSNNDLVQELLEVAKRSTDVHNKVIDDTELHNAEVKSNLARLAQSAYQTAIESVASPMELLSCAEHIAEELVDHEWASILFYEAVKWMDHLNTKDNMTIATVSVLLSDGTIELTSEQIRNVLEILVGYSNVPDHLEHYAILIKTLLGDEAWANKILERAKLVA